MNTSSEIINDKNSTTIKNNEQPQEISIDDSPPSSSSFLMQLQKKLKSGLQPTTTKFVQKDGTVNFYKNSGTEILINKEESSKQQFGFVVDTNPDLSVGKILPWLYVSSQDVAQDVTLLKDLNITHILSLLPGFQLVPVVTDLITKHLVLEFYDEEMFTKEERGNTLNVISQALDFISNVKSSSSSSNSTNKCNVLVHCNAGMSRAPTIVILYLMKKENMTFQDAFEKVKLARPITKPNDGFLKYLQSI